MANIANWREILEGSTAPLYATSTGGAQANNCTLTAGSGKQTFISGFEITGLGATAAAAVAVTLTGTGTTLNWTMAVPAGVGVPCTPLVVQFNPPLAASAKDVNFVLSVPSFGAGNTAATVTVHGFQV